MKASVAGIVASALAAAAVESVVAFGTPLAEWVAAGLVLGPLFVGQFVDELPPSMVLDRVSAVVVGSVLTLNRVSRTWCPIPRGVRSSGGGPLLKNYRWCFAVQNYCSFCLQHCNLCWVAFDDLWLAWSMDGHFFVELACSVRFLSCERVRNSGLHIFDAAVTICTLWGETRNIPSHCIHMVL